MDSVKDKSEYKEMNFSLRAGGNANTIALPMALAFRKDMPDQLFYVSKWKLEEYEKQNFVVRLYNVMLEQSEANPFIREFLGAYNVLSDRYKTDGPYNEEALRQFLLKLVDCMPAVYLSAMGAPTPVNLYYENPFGGGLPGIKDEDAPGFMITADEIAARLNAPNSRPDEN